MPTMMTGVLFDIKRYALHDGPGIRTTVFFKGCPLRCVWCHNPEGQAPFQELLVNPSRCLADCHLCLECCPEAAVSKSGHLLRLDRRKCSTCGACAEVCPTEAIILAGRQLTPAQAAAEIFRDEAFHRQSGGGVTFSGGEPLMQASFLEALLEDCRLRDIHTTVDTSGHVPWPALDSIRPKVQLFLYDLKMMDERRHQELTGVSNLIILENLKRLVQSGSRIIVRLPIIKNLNDGRDHIEPVAEFLRELGGVERVDLLSYHALGRSKYERLDRRQPASEFSAPSPREMEQIKVRIQAYGLEVRREGSV
jgi:pyruvate formate lyase activating enzyme